jgi:mannose-6-phosphate isomerase-like protein (cupin superfamily)
LKLEFNLQDNLDKIKKSNSYFHTFINKDSLATGILMLKPGEEDTQEPHESDEVYFVISGNGYLKIKNKNYEILKDKLFFVEKKCTALFSFKYKGTQSFVFFWRP